MKNGIAHHKILKWPRSHNGMPNIVLDRTLLDYNDNTVSSHCFYMWSLSILISSAVFVLIVCLDRIVTALCCVLRGLDSGSPLFVDVPSVKIISQLLFHAPHLPFVITSSFSSIQCSWMLCLCWLVVWCLTSTVQWLLFSLSIPLKSV